MEEIQLLIFKCLLEGQEPDGTLETEMLVNKILGLSFYLVEPVMVADIFYTLPSTSECAPTLYSPMALLMPAVASHFSALLQPH